MRSPTLRLVALLFGLLLGSCSYSAPHFGASGDALPSAVAAATSAGYLYVANNKGGSVTVYAPGKTSVSRSITRGIGDPLAMAFDRSGTLYVVNGKSVSVYSRGANSPERTLSRSQESAVDVSVNTSQACIAFGPKNGSVNVYGTAGTPLLSTFPTGSLWVDGVLMNQNGNIYADLFNAPRGAHSITEFTSKGKALISLPGSEWPAPVQPLAIDSRNNLYVGYTSLKNHVSQINIYRENSSHKFRELPASWAWALDVDLRDNLYIANYQNNSITEYASQGSQPLRTITSGISRPVALAVGREGVLYVANAGSNSVTEYSPGRATFVLRTITQGIRNPVALALQP